MDDAENGRVGTDAQCERQYGHEREKAALAESAVDGRVVTNPAQLVIPERARLAIGGVAAPRVAWRTIALHKPRGVVTTSRDPEGRPTVYDLLGPMAASVVPVGRLDLASTGLLLLTTDTRLAAWLTDPAQGIVRRYIVTARGRVSDEAVRRMVAGIGQLKADQVTILKRSTRETHLVVELTEGRNREIRRLLADGGHDVTRLLRVSFGGIELGRLQPGTWRDVTRDQIRAAFPSWRFSSDADDLYGRTASAGGSPEARRSQRASRSPTIARHSSSSGPAAARRPARRYQ
jgi:23S rRNA pseudouridine2605 synthase